MMFRANTFAAAVCLITAAVLAGCSAQPPAYQSTKTADDQCRLFRGYLGTQAYNDVMAACTRQLGEAYCRQCLAQ